MKKIKDPFWERTKMDGTINKSYASTKLMLWTRNNTIRGIMTLLEANYRNRLRASIRRSFD